MLGRWTAALVIAGAMVGCDGGTGGTDGGRQDSGGNNADSGSNDSGTPGSDSGTPGEDGGGGGCGSLTLPALSFEAVAVGASWSAPVGLAQPPGSTDLYVVDQLGEIFIVRGGSVLPTPFLDLGSVTDYANDENERGLLGLAFHPDYADNGRFFVYYTSQPTTRDYRNIVAEYARSTTNPDVADPGEVRKLFDVDDPYWNHNGGQIAFGPDGFLYVAMGDGGSGGDPGNEALDTSSMLGKILRLDVDNTAGGFAAAGNPFAGGGGLAQIWAYGLRNPWRFSFDRTTGDLWIGDVGQNDWEEIDFQPASSTGGENYGWAAYEGTHVLRSERLGQASNHTPPVLEYAQNLRDAPIREGFAVTGGYVYRGSAIPGLRGWYVFGDTYSPDHAAFRYCDGEVMGFQRVPGLNPYGTGMSLLTSFGEDNTGELYLLGFSYVLRIIPG